jgi:RNA-binding protein
MMAALQSGHFFNQTNEGNMLSGKEKRALRAEGHHLRPEVWIGKEGISDGALNNVNNALNTKELVKIKLQENCPLEKKEVGDILARKTHAQLVQILGNTILLYRQLEESENKNASAKKRAKNHKKSS